MNKGILLLLAMFCMFSIQTNAQRCNSTHWHENKMINDENYAKNFLEKQGKIESIISKMQKNQKSDGVACEDGNKLFIPVAVHYDYNASAAERVCLIELAQDQINVLNAAYTGAVCQTSPNGFDSSNGGCFEFKLATYNHPSSSGIAEGQPAVTFNAGFCPNDPMGYAPCYIADWAGYMNFVIKDADANGSLGVAGLGSDPDDPMSTNTVINLNCAWGTTNTACAAAITGFPGHPSSCASTHANNAGGTTAVHEAGHFLNLKHVFCVDSQSGNIASTGSVTPAQGAMCQNPTVCSTGCTTTACDCDDVADTPPQAFSQYGCPGGNAPGITLQSNPSGGSGAMKTYNNYMDYVDDACMNCFTAGQATRMRASHMANSGYKAKALVCQPATVACGITAMTADAPVCMASATPTYSVTINYTGSSNTVTINGGPGATPATGTTTAINGSVSFTYPISTATYNISAVDSNTGTGTCSFGPFTGSAPANCSAIPTMGQWGLFILMLLISSIGLIYVRFLNDSKSLS